MKKERKLNHQQELFCKEYLVDFNASRAAKAAKYSEKSSDSLGYQLLQIPLVQQRIKELISVKAKKLDITNEKILNELAKVAFSNMDDLAEWTDSGVSFKHSAKLSRSKKASIKEISQEMNEHGGSLKIKQHDKLKALELLGKYKSLFNDKVEHSGSVSFAHIVIEANAPEPENSN